MLNRNLNRRDFLKHAGAGTAAMMMQKYLFGAGPNKPNVLFIAVDDMNDWVKPFGGHPDIISPNIERIASRGVAFQSAYCSAPLCGPSRCSVLSGKIPANTGIYDNYPPLRHAFPEAVTIPQIFKESGYKVMGAGKIPHNLPDKYSWDEYFPSLKYMWSSNDVNPPSDPYQGLGHIGNSSRHQWMDWGPLDCDDNQMRDGKTANWVVSKLQENHTEPFFLGCGIYLPHVPWFAPRKYFDMYDVNKIALPEYKEDDLDDIPQEAQWFSQKEVHLEIMAQNKFPEAIRAYLAACTFADAQVGKVLDALDNSPYKDNTIIVFWTDHGHHLAEKLHWSKNCLWEEATRTPLIISAPGLGTTGVNCNKIVSLVDIYPTLIDLCGISPPPYNLDGQSLKPLIINPHGSWSDVALTTMWYKNHSIRTPEWRYTKYQNGGEELYDHTNDSMEWTNLANNPAYADIKNQLAQHLPAFDQPRHPPAIPEKPAGVIVRPM
ncbi:sulfatase-like hydrolase/transferase [Spirochaetota bacterium]